MQNAACRKSISLLSVVATLVTPQLKTTLNVNGKLTVQSVGSRIQLEPAGTHTYIWGGRGGQREAQKQKVEKFGGTSKRKNQVPMMNISPRRKKLTRRKKIIVDKV